MNDPQDNPAMEDPPTLESLRRLSRAIDGRRYEGPSWPAILRRQERRRMWWGFGAAAAVAAAAVLSVWGPSRPGPTTVISPPTIASGSVDDSVTLAGSIDFNLAGQDVSLSSVSIPTEPDVGVGWTIPTLSFSQQEQEQSERSEQDEPQRVNSLDRPGGTGQRTVGLL